MTRHTWVVTWPAPFYNAEDDEWFDAVFRFHRFDFSKVDMYPRFPDRDQQAHMGVEFD